MSQSPTPLKNSLRAAAGGVAVVVAALLLMFLNGGGLGSGDGEDETNSGDVSVNADPGESGSDSPPADTETKKADDSESGGLTTDEKQALDSGTLGILIDETEFFMVIPGTDTIYRPKDLSRLVELAELATGDANGIRVRILRRETSRTSAEVELTTALENKGIGQDAVYMPRELLPVAD